jgi:vitamin B12 transporter
MKVVFTVIATCVLALSTFAQQAGSVSGSYRERQPEVGVEIKLYNAERTFVTKTTASDDGASYFFENVPAGTYTLETAKGWILKNVVVYANRVSVVNIDTSLQPSLQSGLAYLTVIASGTLQGDSQVSKTVSIIESQEMRDRADFALVDTLRTIPGFRVQQLGGFGRTASIKSRGLRNQDTALLIDGIRFRDPGSITGDATPFLSDITLTSVKRIEVLRGPGSSLYGTNSIGGTIDFRTPEAREGVHGQVSGAGGGLGLGRFRGNLSYGRPNSRFGITGGFSRTAYIKGIDGEDNASNTNFQTRVDYNLFSNTTFSGRFFVSDASVRLNSSPDSFGPLPAPSTIIDAREGVNFTPDVNDPDSTQDARSFTGQFAAAHSVRSKLIIRGYYQGLATERTNDDGPLGAGFQSPFTSLFGGSIHTTNVHATWIPNASNTLTAGYEFETERFRNEGSTPSGTSDFWSRVGQRSHALYAQHLLSFLDDKLQLAGGVRVQWFSLGRPEFSSTDGPYAGRTFADPPAAYTFDGSASYYIAATDTKFRTHVGNGYRVPSLYERFGTFFFLGMFFPQGNPELRPERSIGIDAGIDQYFADRKVKASATWFYARIKDEITYLPIPDGFAYYNFDRHFSRGVETTIELRPRTSTDIFASYTFTNSDVRNFSRTSIVMVASRDRRAFGIPDHQFTLVATQRIKRFWMTLDLLATSSYLAPVFSSSTFDQYTYRFGGNRRADLTAGYTFRLRNDKVNVRLFGTVENLFDHKYFENGFRTPGRNGRAGVSFGF